MSIDKKVRIDRVFPIDLIEECRKLYTDKRKYVELEKAIKHNHIKIILSFLEEGCRFNLDEDEVIKSFRNKHEKDLLKYAKIIKARRHLYKRAFMFDAGCIDYNREAEDELTEYTV